jgi:hypothetical protein
VTVKFIVKDDGSEALIRVFGGILKKEVVYNGKAVQSYSAGGFVLKYIAKQKNTKGVTTMNIRFSATDTGRRELAGAIGEILGEDAVYNGTPTFAYTVGRFTVDRSGALNCPDDMSKDELSRLIAALNVRGYIVETEETPNYAENSDKLVIDMPLDGFTDKAIENLREIVNSKNMLIKKALGADSLPIDVEDGKLRFPWFTLTGAEGEADAYGRFICALCEMAKRQQRVTAKEKDTGNDKFTMRLFLIRLGFVGAEFKAARRILLRNLSGNTAWKDGRPPQTAETAAESENTDGMSDEQ